MTTSLIKKISLYALSGIAILLTSFFISSQEPGDVLDNLLLREEKVSLSSVGYEATKTKLAHRTGMDKPLFYFSISNLAEAGYDIYFATEAKQRNYYNLLRKYGSSKEIYLLAKECQTAEDILSSSNKNFPSPSTTKLTEIARFIQTNSAATNMDSVWSSLEEEASVIPAYQQLFNQLKKSWSDVEVHKKPYKKYIPAISWSADNRFNDWFFGGPLTDGIIHLDLGYSIFTGEKVASLLKHKILWSLGLSVFAIVISFSAGIPLATWVVYKNNKALNRSVNIFTAFSYALPVYLAGVLLLFLFSNPDVLNILPSSGVKPLGVTDNSTGFMRIFLSRIPYLILPVICYSYSLLAFIVSTSRDLLQHQMLMPYILTARAKGLDEKTIICKHALKNVLPSLITLLSNIFPAIIGGSVIIETLFSIPGMGNEIARACVSRNFPVLSSIILLSGFATLLTYAVVDFAVYYFDPRFKQSATE